ncbi:hypothetical protein AAVH_22148 [Aphelenchoides avenae]|nr:hypothetical protein AAVH_22148 [Aphelenchus avenae]
MKKMKSFNQRIGFFKRYIIANSTCCALFEIVIALVHAEPVLSHSFIVGRGIFDLFPDAPEIFYKFYADTFVFFFWCTVYTTTAMFVYRYSQTMDTLLYRRLLADHYGILWVMLVVAVLAGAFTVPMHFCWGSMEEVKRRMEVEDPVLYTRIKDNPMMVIEDSRDAASSLASFVAVKQ